MKKYAIDNMHGRRLEGAYFIIMYWFSRDKHTYTQAKLWVVLCFCHRHCFSFFLWWLLLLWLKHFALYRVFYSNNIYGSHTIHFYLESNVHCYSFRRNVDSDRTHKTNLCPPIGHAINRYTHVQSVRVGIQLAKRRKRERAKKENEKPLFITLGLQC